MLVLLAHDRLAQAVKLFHATFGLLAAILCYKLNESPGDMGK